MAAEHSFGSWLQRRRKALGLTQEELAQRVGCAAETLRKIEADARRPSRQIAERLAEALELPKDIRIAFVRAARAELAVDQVELPIPSPNPPPAARRAVVQPEPTLKGYLLREIIGTGGFGTVYRAEQPAVGREVAIKIIHPTHANQTEFIRRFEAEAQIIARLEHPHIIPLYDYWRDPSGAYLVMRYVRGGNLQKALGDGPWPLPRCTLLFQQIAGALQLAHQRRIVHRDIKPANILLDEQGHAYLADFGIAKDMQSSADDLTQPGAVVGSPEYLSPEQLQDGPITPQTDIYSLGIMLHEMLIGTHPFAHLALAERLEHQLHTPLPPLHGRRSDLSPMLDAVIQRATAKQPEDRYSGIVSMAAAWQQAVAPRDNAMAWLQVSLGIAPTDDGFPSFTADDAVANQVTVAALDVMENPYKGLRAFGEADAADFFGRAALIEHLLERLAGDSEAARFLAVVGPSGSGKSSVVRAGLVPALRQGALPNSARWFVVELLPGAYPLEELEASLLRIAVNPPESLLGQLMEDERGLARAIKRTLPPDQETELVLVIDQFEELWTLTVDEAIRAHVLGTIHAAVLDPHSRVRVIVTLRADFYDRPLLYAGFGELIRQRTEVVLPLTPQELELAISGPAKRVGVFPAPELVATIVQESGAQPGTLPLLQYALTELFEQRQGLTLTLEAYRASGGVFGALTHRADSIYDQLDGSAQETVQQLFLRLITLGEGVEDTRRRASRAELEALALADMDTPEERPHGLQLSSNMNRTIEAYSHARLLTFDRDPLTREPTVEIAHEALIREWGRLRAWLNAGRADIRLQRLLTTAATEWITARRDADFLLHGARLDQFAGWATSTQMALTQDEREYLDASVASRQVQQAEEAARQQRELEAAQKLAETEAHRAAENARSAWRLRRLAVALAVFLLVALGAAWLAITERNNAQDNFVIAERTRLAAQAQIALDNGEGGDLPALLALRSLRYGYSPEADAALLNALKRGFAHQRYLGHAGGILWVDWSPDGRSVLTASTDHTAILWDAQTGRELRRFIGHTARVNTAIFSPDGRTIVTGSHDNTARLWDAQTGQELRQFGGHIGGIFGAAFTPDGRSIVTCDGTMARLWDVHTGAEKQQFAGHTGDILWFDISLDGSKLVTFGEDKTARLWDLQTGRELRQFLGHTNWVGGAQLSSDSRYLLTTSGDHTARLWDVQTSQELRRYVGHTDAIFDGRFSPDGRYVLTGSYDKTVRLWDIGAAREVRQYLGHTDAVNPVAFSADGRYILTGSQDRTARLWETWPETEPRTLASFVGGHIANMYAVNLSPDTQLLLSARTDGTIQLWDAQTGMAGLQINVSTVANNVLAMSPDNRLVLAGDNAGVARLNDARTGQVVRQFEGHEGPIWAVAFSPEKEYIVTGGEDKTARLWDARTGTELHQLSGHSGPVRAVAFSADGHFIMTGSADHIARLWNVHDGKEVRQFAGHTGAVLAVAFSKDGRFIVTGSDDATARLWVAATGQQVGRSFIGHTAQVTQVVFSPDDRTVLTGSADQTARLWDVETGQIKRQFTGHTTPVQFVTFSPDGRYIYTGDFQAAYRWRTALEEAIAFACTQARRDLTTEERALYNIADAEPTCSILQQRAEVEPSWTPVPQGAIKPAPVVLAVEMEFLNESANIRMHQPIQDVFIDAGNGQVVRPTVLNTETLALPVYTTAVEVGLDIFDAPFDAGPYPKGEPLGFTLGDYVAATGRATYTARGDRAEVNITFDRLVPNGLYTFWCVTLSFARSTMTEFPCHAADGSAYSFTADKHGHAETSMNIAAFPPSTREAIHEIAVAYHSDGRTHRYSVGEHGRNAHGQLFFDFLPPEDDPAAPAAESIVAKDEGAVAREWMQLLVERVQVDMLSPPVASRIYAYTGITLYEAVVPGMSNYKSLQGQLNDLPALPQPEGDAYNWPAVAASASATVAKALFESPLSQATFDQLRDRQLDALAKSGLAPDILARSTAHGERVGQAIVAWIETDGYRELRNKPYTPPTGPGAWIPTSVSRPKPLTPYWGELRPFVLTAADACKPPGPVPYSEDPASAFYAQAREVYETSQTLTAEQQAIALFWSDGPGNTGTPPGHWVSIVNQLSEEQKLPLSKTAELHALVGIGLADSFISCWKEKYLVSLIRPESYIQQHIDPNWQPLIATPPFPEYPSGHSVASAAAAEILTAYLGSLSFTDATHANRGLGVRRFDSFAKAAEEAALSRLYGGIHYRMAIENGLAQGQCIGRTVLDRVHTH